MRLKGKAALVTGAGQGFGFGIAEAFVREGARVACLDLKGEVAEAAAKRFGAAAIALQADVSNREDVERATRAAIEAFGRVDIVVNNAGTTHRNKPLMEVEEAEFDRVFAVNVKSILLTAQAFVPHMRAHGGGVFINVGSTAALRPRPGLTVYNASKGAVHVMTKSMAIELAPDKIRVCALAPVAGETPLLAMFLGEDTPEKRAAFRATVPLGRFSTPHDIGAAALYLASDEAAFLTGVVLEVDGGGAFDGDACAAGDRVTRVTPSRRTPRPLPRNPGGSSRTTPSRRMRVLDRLGLTAFVVDHHAPVGVEDQVMLDAAKREIAVELQPMIVRRRTRREHLDHDDRVQDFHRVEIERGGTDDERVRLERRPSRDPNRHAVGKHRCRSGPPAGSRP